VQAAAAYATEAGTAARWPSGQNQPVRIGVRRCSGPRTSSASSDSSGRRHGHRSRLDLDAGSDEAQVRGAVFETHERWQREDEDPISTRETKAAARILEGKRTDDR
jgi:hypothetical protein